MHAILKCCCGIEKLDFVTCMEICRSAAKANNQLKMTTDSESDQQFDIPYAQKSPSNDRYLREK